MTVTVANNYNIRKPISTSNKIENDKSIKPIIRKTKQQIRNKIDEEEDDETMIGSLRRRKKNQIHFSNLFFSALSSSKLNIAANIPIAPMSPQLQNVRSSLVLSQQQQQQQLPSSFVHESKSSTQARKSTQTSPISQRKSIITTTATNYHRHRQTNADSSTANSSSTSPINLSRSTSPAASIANFIRPISPPCIQVKEPLSPKFFRASSTTMANRHRSPPITVPSIANNIDASTASATTTLLIDDSSGYDSSENQTNRIVNPLPISSIISTVPESCFEPETYRNLCSFKSNQQKKLSLSDPTLNQTTKISRHLQQQQQHIITTTNAHLSTTSLQKQVLKEQPRQQQQEDEEIQTDNEIENFNLSEDTLPKEKVTTNENQSRKVRRIFDINFVVSILSFI
jgi:hypothetical protein